MSSVIYISIVHFVWEESFFFLVQLNCHISKNNVKVFTCFLSQVMYLTRVIYPLHKLHSVKAFWRGCAVFPYVPSVKPIEHGIRNLH
jgi:hypothetical protein